MPRVSICNRFTVNYILRKYWHASSITKCHNKYHAYIVISYSKSQVYASASFPVFTVSLDVLKYILLSNPPAGEFIAGGACRRFRNIKPNAITTRINIEAMRIPARAPPDRLVLLLLLLLPRIHEINLIFSCRNIECLVLSYILCNVSFCEQWIKIQKLHTHNLSGIKG